MIGNLSYTTAKNGKPGLRYARLPPACSLSFASVRSVCPSERIVLNFNIAVTFNNHIKIRRYCVLNLTIDIQKSNRIQASFFSCTEKLDTVKVSHCNASK
jgi:hypothetical protein